MVGDLERLAYESALGALEKQEHVLDELRARTGVLLAASSVATSFLGGRAVAAGASIVVVAAMVAFGLLVAASVVVLVPRRDAFTLKSLSFSRQLAVRWFSDGKHRSAARQSAAAAPADPERRVAGDERWQARATAVESRGAAFVLTR